jgi:hypothetical protein
LFSVDINSLVLDRDFFVEKADADFDGVKKEALL